MPVWVRCDECGTDHPSRFRAPSKELFLRLDPFVGPILEPCPSCGARGLAGSPGREWREGPLALERPGAGRRWRSPRRLRAGE